ncbi:hypothetical protein Vca1114GL_00957 [Vibrio campbellii]|uniref:hypothetical protein n=1 Tax=Vibrio campbellii TaxID=680 RepID=UPI00097FB102|nr:hypothetical protein [Vibrio campbellii]AQM67477.1 hypothetical protein Vca1114GL_00957 [Vibrio campbellii]
MTFEDVIAFINCLNHPALLTTERGMFVHANKNYKDDFHGGTSDENVIDKMINNSSHPLLKANAMYCKYIEGLFLENKKTLVSKELFFYESYLTLRSLIRIGKSSYTLLIIVNNSPS